MLKEILNHIFLVNIFICILKWTDSFKSLLIDSFSIWGATLSLQISWQRKTFKYGLAERVKKTKKQKNSGSTFHQQKNNKNKNQAVSERA